MALHTNNVGRRNLIFVAPALILVAGIVYVGILYNIWISTYEWNGIDPVKTFVGLDNYREALKDPIFIQSLRNITVFAAGTVLAQMAIGLVLAILLDGPIFAKRLYRVLVFVPVVIAPAATSVAFRYMLAPDGAVNELFRSVGLGFLAQAWVADPKFALYALIGVNIWQWTGFSFVMYQAGLSQIDQHLYEAAQIDGAGYFRTFRSIVLPSLRSTHLVLVITGVIGAIKTFDIVFLITGGGPGRSTEFLTTYIYKESVQQFNTGYGATLSIFLLALAFLFTVVQNLVNKERNGKRVRKA